MANDFSNPAANPHTTGPTVSHPAFRTSPARSWRTPALADDGTYTVALADDGDANGLYFCYDEADPTDGALFAVRSTGTTINAIAEVADAAGTHTWADADTDTDYCFFVSGGEAVLKNRSGDADVVLCIARLA